MKAFQALSNYDKLRASRYLTRGEAPSDPRMAAAAIELAESYQRRSRTYMALMRWSPVIVVVCTGYVAIPAAVEGSQAMSILFALVVLLCAGIFMFDPATRPKSIVRSLEASRRVVASRASEV